METTTPSPTNESFSLLIDERALATQYAAGQYEELVHTITTWLKGFNKARVMTFSEPHRRALDTTSEAIGFYLTRQDFNLSRKKFLELLSFHQPLTNLFANSNYRTTDHILKGFLHSPAVNLPSAVFYNVRASFAPPRAIFFDIDPELASEWYGQYFFGIRSFVNENALTNLKAHFEFWDDRMHLKESVSNGYMRSTYFGEDIDRRWKFKFNQFVKTKFKPIESKIVNKPDYKHIAVATGRWSPINPTYKNRLPLFKALAKKYKLTLVHVGPDRNDLETSIFHEVTSVKFEGGRLVSKTLFNNTFGVLFYPDIGMNVESRFLSNLRLAPIQLTTNSHPASTFGSEIDFFLTGIESEETIDPSRHYSERLVLVPGIGTQPVYPEVAPKKPETLATGAAIRIGCPWGCLKVNRGLILSLKEIKRRSNRRVIFRFLISIGADSAHVPPVRRDIEEILGPESVELYVDQPYNEYMKRLEECDMALDAFPFGGNTSIVDCMALRIPIVVRDGWTFYNMAGPVILRRFGLDALIAKSENDYIRIATALITQPEQIRSLMQPLYAIDAKEKISGLTSEAAYISAFQQLTAKKPDPRHRDPLIIK